MVGGFFRKWFGGSAPTPPPPSAEVQEALADLARLGQDKPALAGPAAMLTDLLPRLYQDPIRTEIPSLSTDRARVKLASGLPLLRGESFQIDEKGLHGRWQVLCDAVERHQGGDLGQRLKDSLAAGRLDPGDLLGNVLAGRADAIHARVTSLGLDPGLTATILRLLLIPVLRPVNERFLPLSQGLRWEAGYCPTCGSWPLLGEVRGTGQPPVLRCGLCTAAWAFPRKVCPFCSEDDARFIGSFTVEGDEDRYHVATCQACHGYLKLVQTARPLTGPQLLVADLATMHLDLAAAERGYTAAE
jgi:FdhE protein